MKKKIILAISALSVAAVIGLTSSKFGVVSADPYYSAEDIRNQVTDLYPGEITELEFEKKGNQYIYEVEIELDGKEYELKINGDTGEVLKLEENFTRSQDAKENNTKTKDEEQTKEQEEEYADVKKEEKSTNNNNSTQTSTPKTAELAKNENSNKDSNSSSNSSSNNKTTENKSSTKSKTANSKTVIGLNEAKRIASTQFNGTVVEIELDDDDNRLIYEIEMKNKDSEADIEIDAYTGKVLVLEIERENNNHSKKAGNTKVIGIEEAKRIALQQFSGTVKEIELDDDNNRLIYEIEIKNGNREAEIEIDAYTGKVLEVDIDDD